MQVIFIRHCEPDYTQVMDRNFIGHGIDMAPLTQKGKEQAFVVANDKRLENVELILSSPYTRALQTAAIISKQCNIPLEVETDLHEWLPDLSHTFSSMEMKSENFKLFAKNKGKCPSNSPLQYEEYQHMFDRANNCLKKYLSYDKIAVVTHGLVLSAFCYPAHTQWGDIVEFEFTDDLKWQGWADT